jgi:GntR family transcriptional regulator
MIGPTDGPRMADVHPGKGSAVAYIERGQALYTQLANALREQITSGALPPGSPLPSEAEMRATYGVSRPTARAAINALRAEGIVTVLHGKGSFVRHTTVPTSHTHHRAITHTPRPTSRGRGRGRTTTTVRQGAYTDTATEGWTVLEEPGRYRTDATPTLALALVIPERAPVFVYHRVLDQAGQRMTHRLYLPVAVCAEIPALTNDPFRTPSDLYTQLAAHHGELTWTEHVRASMPTPQDTHTLQLPEATPLLITHRTTHTHAGQPLALEITHLSAEGAQLAYTLTATTHETTQNGTDRS